jgi:hypothetical protein
MTDSEKDVSLDIKNITENVKALVDAVESAGFRLSKDLLGKPTLWCIECGRDNGFHWTACSKHSDQLNFPQDLG